MTHPIKEDERRIQQINCELEDLYGEINILKDSKDEIDENLAKRLEEQETLEKELIVLKSKTLVPRNGDLLLWETSKTVYLLTMNSCEPSARWAITWKAIGYWPVIYTEAEMQGFYNRGIVKVIRNVFDE